MARPLARPGADMTKKAPVALAVAGLIAVSGVAAAAPATAHYDFHRVHVRLRSGAVRVATQVVMVTTSGDTVGALAGPGPNASRAFITEPGGATTWLHVAGFANTLVDAASEGGTVVITVYGAHRATRVDLRHPNGKLTRIRVPGLDPASVVVTGVNDSGDLVGSGFTKSGQSRSFLERGGRYRMFAVPVKRATMTFAAGINDAGVIVGSYTDRRGVTHGFFDQHGQVQIVRLPGAGIHAGHGSAVQAISDSGSWLGVATTDRATVVDYVKSPGQHLVTLRYPQPHTTTYVTAINSQGVVVGTFYSAGSRSYHAFVATPTA